MDISVVYLTKFTHEGDFMAIFVGCDAHHAIQEAINTYDIDVTVAEVLEAVSDNPGAQLGSWSFEVGHLDGTADMVLRMSSVEASDMWRGEDGDV